MVFSSPVFLFAFLPLTLLVYFQARGELRNAILLLASLLFYAWGETFLVALMLLSIAVNWAAGLRVARAQGPARRAWLVAGVAFNLGLLVAFKYADWLWSAGGAWLAELGWVAHEPPRLGALLPAGTARALLATPDGGIRLPIGVSFFTFQAISYVVDVYRGDVEAQRNPGRFAVYLSLFPQLIAGPIVRYHDVARDIGRRVVTSSDFSLGARRFVVGLGKKVLIANHVARVADAAFAVPAGELTPALAWTGAVAYALQIYFDFSGYSDMAIGLGRMLGFRFLENFRYPYVAASITEFWRRWHISLSTWFRDYLYVPLGGNRGGAARTYRNLLVVFLLCGLWHGASVTFVVWGLFHGAFLVLERAGFGAALARLPRAVRHAYVLLAVLVGWVFFRAEAPGDALAYLAAMAGLQAGDAAAHPVALHADAPFVLTLLAGLVGSVPWLERARAWYAGSSAGLRAAAEVAALAGLAATLFLSTLELAAGAYDPFIYFRF